MSRQSITPGYVLVEKKQPAPSPPIKALATMPRSTGRRVTPLPTKKKPKRRQGWRDVTVGDTIDYGWKAYQMVKDVVRLINVEEKVFDVDGTGSSTTVTSTPLVVNLSNIAQGTDYYQRIGQSIKLLSIEFSYSALGSSAQNGNMLRLLVLQDRENQGVDPTLGEVLTGLSTPILALPHPLYRQRFRILVDEKLSFTNYPDLATSGTSTGYVPDRKAPKYFSFKMNGHMHYDATAGADASNLEGALFLMAVSLDAANGPGIRYSSRITFTDN